jgi:hypothetical protein
MTKLQFTDASVSLFHYRIARASSVVWQIGAYTENLISFLILPPKNFAWFCSICKIAGFTRISNVDALFLLKMLK